MVRDGISLTYINDRASESVGQDHTARMSSLILLFTLCNINQLSLMAGYGLNYS